MSGDSASYEAISNPYGTTSDAATMGWTRTKYDTNGRAVELAHYDGDMPPYPFNGASQAPSAAATVVTTWSGYAATVTDEAGHQKKSTYDALGRLVSVQENPAGSGPTTSYAYDYADRLRGVTQGSQMLGSGVNCPGGVAVSRCFAYDALGRLAAAVNPESGTTSYTYDSNGNLVLRVTPTATTTRVYDHLNRVTGKSYSGSLTPAVTYCYDGSTAAAGCSANPAAAYATGRLTMTTNGNSTTSILGYDPVGRVVQSQQTTGMAQPYSFTYAYNLLDGIASETYPSQHVVTTSYDNAGRPNGVQNATAATAYASGVMYAANNAMKSMVLGNGVVEGITFNTRFQPTAIQAGVGGGSSLIGLGFTYGSGTLGTTANNGNVLTASIASANGSFNQYFVYDAINRLQIAVEDAASAPASHYGSGFACPGTATSADMRWCEQSSYDIYGNRLITASTNLGSPANVAGSMNTMTNQNSGGTWHHDGSGNIDTDGMGTHYGYDAENRQISAGGATYAYDGDGRRVGRTTADGNRTTYVYDAFGNLAAEYGTAAPTVTGTTYLTADHLGSTRLVTSATNTLVNGASPGGAGTALECRDYLPFGEVLILGRNSSCTGADAGVTQLFTGKERDAETGLDYFGARYMSSAQGRFTSPDPLMMHPDRLFEPQRLNLYVYARNNPLRYVDPNGLDDISYDQAGNETDRVKRSKWHNFWFGDSWKLNADNGKTYSLDSSLKPLKDGQRYEIVSGDATKQGLGGFLAGRANGWNNNAGMGDVLTKSPSGAEWDFKRQALTPDESRTSLFEYGSGSLYHADYIGNIAWGFIMASFGYPETFSKAGAGAYQGYEAVRGRTGFGNCFTSYCDDPRDTEAIGKGYTLWRNSSSPYLVPTFDPRVLKTP